MHWLPTKARLIYKLCLLVHKTLKFHEPKYLLKHLNSLEPTSLLTRAASNPYTLKEIRVNKNIGKRSFAYSGPHHYNSLPNFVKESKSLEIFKNRLKHYLFTESYDLENLTIKQNYII